MAEDDELAVTRFEWSFRPFQAKFTGLRYLSEYTFEGFLRAAQLCHRFLGAVVHSRDDRNHASRWALSPLWAELRDFIDDWSENYQTLHPAPLRIKAGCESCLPELGGGLVSGAASADWD